VLRNSAWLFFHPNQVIKGYPTYGLPMKVKGCYALEAVLVCLLGNIDGNGLEKVPLGNNAVQQHKLFQEDICTILFQPHVLLCHAHFIFIDIKCNQF